MRYILTYLLLLFSVSIHSQFVAVSGGGAGEPSQLLDSLFAYYPLDESSGNFEDVHGGRDLTASGTLTYSVSGKVGTCVTFITDGQGKYTADDFEFAGSFSISAWVKTGNASTWQGIVTYYGNGGSGDRGWSLRKNAGGAGSATGVAVMYYVGGNVLSVSTSAINDDGWHHVVFTFDSSDDNMRVYVDGDLEDTDNNTNAAAYDTDCDLEIGSVDDGQFWDGEIDEVAIYRGRALAEGSVDSLWNTGSGLAYPLDF
jgi:hypothetical protein